MSIFFQKYALYFFILFFYYIPVLFEIFNDLNVKKVYDNMIYNWNSNPISSIEFSNDENYELAKIKTNKNTFKFYKWRNKSFKITKLTNYNYIEIYNNKNGKLCGKDTFGNDLYFPEEIDCPINDIFISDKLFNNSNDYKKIYLDNNYYLYYTNKNIKGKILIDIKAGSSKGFQLNLEIENTNCMSYIALNKYIFKKKKEKCSSFDVFNNDILFYQEIDKMNYSTFINVIEDSLDYKINLYSINYYGINSTLMGSRKNLKNYSKYLTIYKQLYIYKFVMYFILCIIMIIFSTSSKIFCNSDNDNDIIDIKFLIIEFTVFFILLIHLIVIIINFTININYIQNFMRKIDFYFDEYISGYAANIINLIILILIFINQFIILILYIRKYYKNRININEDHVELANNNNNGRNENNNNVVNNNNIQVDNNINENNNNVANNNNIQVNNNLNENNNNDANNNNIQIDNNLNEGNNINEHNNNNINVITFNRIYNREIQINNRNIENSEENRLENREENENSHKCIVCLSYPSKIIIVPCGHKCICIRCYNEFKRNNYRICPVCRRQITYYLENIYEV